MLHCQKLIFFFFSGYVSVAHKLHLPEWVFFPLRVPGQGTGSRGDLDFLHCQSCDNSQSIAWQEICYTLQSSGMHSTLLFHVCHYFANCPYSFLSLCHHGIRSLHVHSIVSNLSPSAPCLPIPAIPANFLQLSLKSRKISR